MMWAMMRPMMGATSGTSAPTEIRPRELPGDLDLDPDADIDQDRPWVVLVWNDPINLMSYVTYVLQKLFGHSLEKATELMLQVHREGRAVVAEGSREQAEMHVFRLHEHGLWATCQHDR
jgi:ATP-dependent Clp protease adaptor protein ClpS